MDGGTALAKVLASGERSFKKEIEKFSNLASEWWNPNGKFKPLHKFNPIRIEYIKDNIIKTLKTHTSLSIKHLYSWNYEDSIILCYGSIKGDAGDENKHDLPPNGDKQLSIDNSDTQLLFGKIFIFRKSKSRFRNRKFI